MEKNSLKKYALLLSIFLIGKIESAKTIMSDGESKERSAAKQANRDKKKEKQKKAADKSDKDSKKSSDSSKDKKTIKDKKSTEKDSIFSLEEIKIKEKSSSKQDKKGKKEKTSSKKDKDTASKKTKSNDIMSDEEYEKKFLTFGFGIDENAKTKERSPEKQANRDKKKEKQEKGVEKKKVADKKKADENSLFGKIKTGASKAAKSVAKSDIANALQEATSMLAVSAIQQGVKKGVNAINKNIGDKDDIKATTADDGANEEVEIIEEVTVKNDKNKKKKEIAQSKEHEEKAAPKEEEIEELVEEQEEALEVEPNFDHSQEKVTAVVVEEKHTPESTSQTAVVSAVSAPVNSGGEIARGGGAKRGGAKKRGSAKKRGKRAGARRRGR